MIEDIWRRMLREFAERLQESLVSGDGGREAAPEPLGVEQPAPPIEPPAGTDAPAPGIVPDAGGAAAPGPAPQPPGPAAPAQPLAAAPLVGSVLAERIRRGAIPFLAGFMAGFLVALILRRRRSA